MNLIKKKNNKVSVPSLILVSNSKKTCGNISKDKAKNLIEEEYHKKVLLIIWYLEII